MLLTPSIKTIKVGYFFCLLLAAAIGGYMLAKPDYPRYTPWLFAVPALLFLRTALRHLERRLVKLEILGDHLRWESGLFSKTTRNIELLKVQDVRVDQTLGQRMWKVGDLSLETAGQGSNIVMRSIDNPQSAAEHILGLAKAQRAHLAQGPAGAAQAGGV
jgi:uncharacterized membrane protein YdbT with pleckstrin-like domain